MGKLTNDDLAVLNRIRKYNKPVKTKHLAPRVNMDRPKLVSVLNKLKKLGLVGWHIPKPQDDKQYYGWVKITDAEWVKL